MDGKWKVTSSQANRGIYVNLSGATQKVLFTVCSTAGGTIDVLVNNGGVASLGVGNCVTIAQSFAQSSGITLHLTSGTTANGTYGIKVLP